MSIPGADGAAGGSAAWADAESSIARVRSQLADTIARAEEAQQLKGRIAAVRGRATSPRGEVEVEVDATGRLLDITFDADVARLAPAELSRAVLAAVARAQRSAGDEAIALTADVFGEGSETVALIRGEVDERMPRLPDDDEPGYR
jgi:Uncharacterised BCR, YbaB family COG0718.